MSNRTISLNEKLYAYLLKVSLREPPILKRLRDETARHPKHSMQISPEQGQFMRLLVRLMGANRCIEVGVFTGYSSLSVAMALADEGRIVACDVSEEYTAVAKRYWKQAGVDSKIDLRIGPAVPTLDAMLRRGEAGRYDFAFIDADKRNYLNYYERLLRLLRPGGLIAVDNVLWGGSVIDSRDRSIDTLAIRRFNKTLQSDKRIELSMVPIGDGLTLARKHP
ncbi:MAG: class I SAM-dependent methyltransferase [Gammaproteobacteria bacterium]|nr:class I SAM-dependent methyltransferase [Gammaproteobacteria bacterium]MDE2346726.1 class I SAM-dependent methyltransferase [Gammaproteobacteria bacterium]